MENGTGGQMAEQHPRTHRSPSRPGRKFGPVRADTEEYKALATFLRTRMEAAGMTVQALVDSNATGLSKSAISERLAGAKLDEAFVRAVVEACTTTPELRPSRGRLLAEGSTLLATAEHRRTPVLDATREKDPVIRNVAVAAQARLLELHEELHAKNGRLEALTRVRHQSELALRDATNLASVLSVWVVVLADEVEHLSRARELTMSAVPADLPRLVSVDAELTHTIERHDRTTSQLARTERDRQLATALLAEAMTRTREIRREMLRLRAAVDLPPSGTLADTVADAPVGHPDLAPQSAYGDDVDAALDRAEAVSRTIADRLRDAVTDLDDGAETLPLSAADTAYAEEIANNTDNAATSADVTENPTGLWWDMLGEVPTEAFAWAEETAVSLWDARDPADPRFGELVRDRRPREVMLVADRLLAHRWAEGSVRLRAALALALPPEELAPLVLALARTSGSMQRAEQGAQMLLAAVLERTPGDVLSLTNLLAEVGDELPRRLRWGIAAFVRRPKADVTDYLRGQLALGRRMSVHNDHVIGAVVRELPTDEILALVDELYEPAAGEESDFGWLLFQAIPQPAIDQTELLLHLWSKLPRLYFTEMLPGLYRGNWKEVSAAVAALHQEWPPPLDRAAREMSAQVMPEIIRRESVSGLDSIAGRLTRLGLSPERIFAPYRKLLTPEFIDRPRDDGV
ncbi:hypothetical protein [Streptomyces sp. NPDC086777]|uniref:hypothetical protein n=1 Tax=Streptomyces sp. NPDC086777 TaxID=3154866 RepID=UPI00344E3DE1